MPTYRPEILEELVRHGIRPTPATDPRLVHGFVNDLYRFELRRLRERLLRREIARREYAGYVIALRKRYLVLSVPVELWTEKR